MSSIPTVLVVEDNPRVLRSVVRLLERQFRVATAVDGEAGLAAAVALVPDLILTDLVMPRMTGEQLVHEVRKHEALAATPIVLLSGYSDDEMRVRMLREGALDYITKPFHPRELLTRVANLIALKRARELLEHELDCRDRDLHAMADELVSRKRDLEAALGAARLERDRAQRASEAKTDLLRLVSHELLTPVAALRLIAERLERDRQTPLAAEHLERVRRIIALTGRLSGEIESLLDHVRFESGVAAIHAESVDLGALAAEVVAELRPQAEQKGLELSVTTDPGVPPVQSDRRMLRVIIANLASNAVKFTDAGSVTVTVLHGDGSYRVAVKDTGPGISPLDRARIFEVFEQLAPVEHKHTPGLGLGLTLAREAAAALSGHIELDTVEGGGSTFTLVLPERTGERGASR